MLGAIVKALLGFFKLWYDGERREAAEWEAKAMRGKVESIKTSDAVERRIGIATPLEVPTTAAAWNKKARRGAGLLLLLCFILPGCLFTKYVHIEGKWPVIGAPARPMIPSEPIELTVRERILVGYSMVLEVKIDVYNKEARAHNVEHGYTEDGREGP